MRNDLFRTDLRSGLYYAIDHNEKGRAQHGPDCKLSSASPKLCVCTAGLSTLLALSTSLQRPLRVPHALHCRALLGADARPTGMQHQAEAAAVSQQKKGSMDLSNNTVCT